MVDDLKEAPFFSHPVLGTALAEWLTPTAIEIETDVPVLKQPPEVDFVLFAGGDHNTWTEMQRQRLPDGIRDADVSHVVIEFKYTESLNEDAFFQASQYYYKYREMKKLEPEQILGILMVSKSSMTGILEKGYYREEQPGVYASEVLILHRIKVLLLNELADTPHNAVFKYFASQMKERLKAFQKMQSELWPKFSKELQELFTGLHKQWFSNKGGLMPKPEEMTVDYYRQLGRESMRQMVQHLDAKELLKGVSMQERLAGVSTQERLDGISSQERLDGISSQERLNGISTQERLDGISIQERLEGVEPEELAKSLSPEFLEALIQNYKK